MGGWRGDGLWRVATGFLRNLPNTTELILLAPKQPQRMTSETRGKSFAKSESLVKSWGRLRGMRKCCDS